MKGPGLYGGSFYSIKEKEDLIRENIIRVLLTSPGERPMSSFGCKLKDFLLEQANVLREEAEEEVRKALQRWEPRISINNVFIDVVEERKARVKIDCIIKEDFRDFDFDTIIRF